MKAKKLAVVIAAMAITLTAITGCGSTGSSTDTQSTTEAASDTTEDTTETTSGGASGAITVVSREDGSGTRGAFTELMGIVEEQNGEDVDMTTTEASVTNSTSVMMTTVAGDVNAIGYISLGSLNDTITAVDVDGVAATAENVSNGTYKVSRPFNIATKGDVSEVAQDFINYILSDEGQAVVEEEGYIKLSDTTPYESAGLSGKIVVAGSSSVTPVMEKLKEAYVKLNADVSIEVQQSDSSTGMQSTIDGICDIGMASRELKAEETDAGLTAQVIAIDGIAVIVNNDNGRTALTSDQIKSIYVGDITEWEEVN
ncbi:MAG: substrate-binding domain-containing protein [Lachnospiraceae bacterium]